MLHGAGVRLLGTPVVALLGLVNTAIIVRETGQQIFGLVSLVATVTALLAFLDFGVGATVTNASARLSDEPRDGVSSWVVRRGYSVLMRVAGALVVLALCVMALDGWSVLTGFASGPHDRWAVTVAACLFAVSIPANLGVRILIGLDRNALATMITMSGPAFALLVTVVLQSWDVPGIWFAVSSIGGSLLSLLIGTMVAARVSGLGRKLVAGVPRGTKSRGMLIGSGWIFLAALGTCAGLQAGRFLLAHLSSPAELSQYALMAQLYAMAWSVIATAGFGLWPAFVQNSGAVEQSLLMWRRLISIFGVVSALAAILLVLTGRWVADLLSAGDIDVSVSLCAAFGVLLIVQAMSFPAQLLLHQGPETRWRAITAVAMAIMSLGVAMSLSGRFGAVGVVGAAAFAVVVAQLIPSVYWAPRLVRRRGVDVRAE